jgi:UDP-N-acetylmuramate dehydrogenase
MADGVRLSDLTTIRTGGTPERYWRPATAERLASALSECAASGLPWHVLGGGSNLLVDDGHLDFGVIHIHASGFGGIVQSGPRALTVGAGVRTPALLAYCRQRGLAGLEFLAGIPGTVGGAIAGNAGAWGRAIVDAVVHLDVMRTNGRRETVPRAGIDAGYRRLHFGDGVIIGAELKLHESEPHVVAARAAGYARRRARKHPMNDASAGCVFKNPPGDSAGRLLDLCRLKGRRVGNAVVSSRHANFVVNRGGATAQDVLLLIEAMRSTVLKEFDVELELEIRRWSTACRAA